MIGIRHLLELAIIYLIFFIVLNVLDDEDQDFIFLDKKHSTIIKGIAIILVLTSHMGGIFGIRYLTPLGGIGVSLFLIVSGYGLYESYKINGLDNFWKKRVWNIFIPYIIVQILMLPMRDSINIIEFILDILLINPLYMYGWYMNYILKMYILFYIIIKYIKDVGIQKKIFFVASILQLFIYPEIEAEQCLSFFSGIMLSIYNPFITIDTKNKIPYMKKSIILLIIGIAFLVIKQTDMVRNSEQYIFNIIQLMIKLPIALSLIIISYLLKNIISYKFIAFMGNISLYIYLIHGYLIGILLQPNIIKILIFILLSIISANIINKFYNIIRKINYKLFV